MDADRFDAVTRLLSARRSRRGLGPLLGGLAAGGVNAPHVSLPDIAAVPGSICFAGDCGTAFGCAVPCANPR